MTNPNAHILIVDDNPENIRVLGTILRQTECQLMVAQSGVQALETVDELIPDLILLDVMMPEMDGFQVCEILKSNPKTQDIEIIFVTAAVAQDDELKGLALGAVDYIHKPFSIPIVQAKVALHLERVKSKKELALKNALLEENSRLRDTIEHITRHDLKNPLNAILGFPQIMLLDDNLTKVQRGYLEQILSAGNEMLNMINNSFDLFKMETGCYPYHPEAVDMVSVMMRVMKDLQMLTESYQVDINVSVNGEQDVGNHLLMVLAENSLSYSLFANLIRNAIEACQAHDVIRVEMKSEANQAVISITNPGTVPELIRDVFFEKYTTSGKLQGTGLGTYSAKLMTTTQNGTIAMTTDATETTVTVRLPTPADV